VEYLQQVGVERLLLALQPLVNYLRDGLEGLGFHLFTPPEPGFASGMISFAHSGPERAGRKLRGAAA
jgi:hypothetical protein